MSVFERLTDTMDAQVDNRLGDSITYKVNDGDPVESSPGVPTIPGFIINEADDGGLLESIQSTAQRWRLKVRKTWLPARPSMKDIVESPKLPGRFRPAANTITEDGRYWFADLQRAP